MGFERLWTVPSAGGPSDRLPAPWGHDGAYSPDGKKLVVDRMTRWDVEWRRYRGGQNTPLTILDLGDLSEIRAVEDVTGVANVRHLVLAIATARNEQQAHAYIRGLDRSWHLRTDGLSNADSLGNGATSNIRRHVGELFEIAAASWLVDNQLVQVSDFQRAADPFD